MTIDLQDTLKKASDCAERATAEDAANHFKEAVDAYMSAADWLLYAVKYGYMNQATKLSLREKLKSYIQRVEQIQAMMKGNSKAQPTAAGDAKSTSKAKVIASSNQNGEDSEMKQFMEKFATNIVSDPKIKFEDVVGLEQAKLALKEAVILPNKYPKFFRGNLKPWSGILLYGPPGTGKSYLAKAIATECKSTFISVSSSDLLSKWLGDSEKAVKALFLLARERQPCIVFIDEIDALCGQRNDTESESSRRVKNEFLGQMEGVGTDNTGVLLLAATNIPWEIDPAMQRRFQKRIYIPLPDVAERAAMFKTHLGANTYHTIQDREWMELAQKSERYSGSDIAVVCREALLRPIRRLLTATHFKQIANPEQDGPEQVWICCSPGDTSAKSLQLDDLDPDELCHPPVTMSDMLAALSTQRPTVNQDNLKKQDAYTEQYGQAGS